MEQYGDLKTTFRIFIQQRYLWGKFRNTTKIKQFPKKIVKNHEKILRISSQTDPKIEKKTAISHLEFNSEETLGENVDEWGQGERRGTKLKNFRRYRGKYQKTMFF